mmetsp:Transcript_29732/g.42436  ORF Transcript_29732/g.42436 Transcript_29732/m.42436 type:complete len:247 (-) Transcript_29732:2317-3057(-)
MAQRVIIVNVLISLFIKLSNAFKMRPFTHSDYSRLLVRLHGEENPNQLEYVNPLTKLLSNFLPSKEVASSVAPVNWSISKYARKPLPKMILELESALKEKEWFVTGNVDPRFFDDNFSFEDPDVKVTGLKEYCRGVQNIFNQKLSRAEIIKISVDKLVPDTINVIWRLSGAVNIAFGLKIKPFIVYTDFTINPTTGLILSQRDRFSIPGYDILISSLFPWLADKLPFLSLPAPNIDICRKEFNEKK